MTSSAQRAADLLSASVSLVTGAGRRVIIETEVYPSLAALGFRVPTAMVVDGPDEMVDLDGLPGDCVVLKLLSCAIPHRSAVGGVRVVGRTAEAVRAGISELQRASPDPEARFLVQEFVPHGSELLLGARWTDEFGPVVTLAPGGVDVEALANMVDGKSPGLVFSPRSPGDAMNLASSSLGGHAIPGSGGGGARVASATLLRTAQDFARFVDAVMPALVTEIEVNPLIFQHGRPVALDALAVVPDTAPPDHEPTALTPARRHRIQKLLSPESVAVVGVSRRMNPGRIILRNLLGAGFPAESIRVVKPDAVEVDGCTCVPDLASLAPGVDLLVLSVGSRDVPELMEEVVGGRLAEGVVLIPGGLGEGGSNTHLGAAVRRTLDEAGDEAPVVNGGNCLGVRSVPGRCNTLFIPPRKLAFPDVPPHPIAVISQSGAFAIARASAMPWLNPTSLVTVGNQLDLTVGEYLEALADNPDIRVFACYVEGFREMDGLRFVRVARRLSAQGRAVILYRAGRTLSGAAAAASHTASVAGDYSVTRGLAEAAGVLLAETLDDFEDLVTTAVLLDGRSVSGSRVGAISNAGFECVAFADTLGMLEASEFTTASEEELKSILEEHRLDEIVSVRNPLDVTPIMDDPSFLEAARVVLTDSGVDVGVLGCVPLTPSLRTLHDEHGGPDGDGGVLPGLVALWGESSKAWVAVVDGGPPYDALAHSLAEAGIPTFRRGDRALRALGHYSRWRAHLETHPERPTPI